MNLPLFGGLKIPFNAQLNKVKGRWEGELRGGQLISEEDQM